MANIDDVYMLLTDDTLGLAAIANSLNGIRLAIEYTHGDVNGARTEIASVADKLDKTIEGSTGYQVDQMWNDIQTGFADDNPPNSETKWDAIWGAVHKVWTTH